MITLFVSEPVVAVTVEGLYKSSVIVSSRENERVRRQGFSTALQQVLVKVTGRRDVLELGAVRRAVANPESYVEFWEYTTFKPEPSPPGTPADAIGQADRIQLLVTFFAPQIQSLLEQNSIPVWPENRPATLVWMVVQEELGPRQIGSVERHADLLREMNSLADSRGVPLLMPLLDVEDQRAISAEQIWNLEADAIHQASARYQTDSVLVVRLFRSLGGELLGTAAFYFRNGIRTADFYGEDLSSVMARPVDLVAEELSAYYAVLASGAEVLVNMTVEGIDSVKDYAGLMSYVQKLVDVNKVTLVRADQQTLDLTLSTGGQIRQLIEAIALDRNLRPVTDAVRENNVVLMHYQWVAP
ncbi:MAG: DUF2066 domain-containing protein [Pseudomonadales bacterium]|nr:DUF2066 domain-containing protein [Pseudomonadales bacterium]